MNKVIPLTILGVLLTISMGVTNGGDQRVVAGKYLINLSRAPFTPHTGDKVSFLVSFVDIEKNKLVSENLIVTVRIAKLGGAGRDRRTFLLEREKIGVSGGILELPYVFAESGLHEIFFDFAFASNPEKIYETPDFLLDVQKPSSGYGLNQILIGILGGLVIGFIGGRFIKRILSLSIIR